MTSRTRTRSSKWQTSLPSRPRRPSGAGRRVLGLQLAAVGLVAALLALLIWRVIDQRRGAHLVSLIKEGKKPPAPSFALPVLWNRTETWPADTRKALTDGKLSPKELRGVRSS